jgi:UDP-N-acetylglucosamine--N-acetylmuramyl-(pentapeptide) pyrophosphoryl-undecaprenol N-acetylglucosamine transferase
VRDFIDDMAAAYGPADLVVCRAGATTVAELGVVGRPALLIPYPFAADNHQEKNARALADAGAAVLCRQAELDGPGLARTVRALLEDPDRLARMAEAMRALGRPDAAAVIVDWLEDAVLRRAPRGNHVSQA